MMTCVGLGNWLCIHTALTPSSDNNKQIANPTNPKLVASNSQRKFLNAMIVPSMPNPAPLETPVLSKSNTSCYGALGHRCLKSSTKSIVKQISRPFSV